MDSKDSIGGKADKPKEDVVIKGHTVDEPLKSEPVKTEHKEEEEISFDLSKIKKWWKSDRHKKKKQKEHHHTKRIHSHDKAHHQKKNSNDEVSLPSFGKLFSKESKQNLKKFATFLITWQVLLLLLIPLCTSVYIRLMPIGMPIASEWAQTSINNQIQSQISNQVLSQYPNLPDSKKQELIDREFQKFIRENRDQYDSQREAIANQFRERYKDDQGQRYLPNIDPYYYARHARSIVEKGHVGDYLNEEGIPINTHQTAPREKPAERHFHMYFTAYFYKFVSIFSPNAGFLNTIALIPILIATSAIIPIFFIARRYGGPVAGFFAAMILAVNHVFMGRTAAGVMDTDAYTVAFPLFITWAFLLAFDATTQKKQIIYSLLTGVLLAFFSFAWSGWWYIFDFILVTLGIYFVYVLITHREYVRHPSKMLKSKQVKDTIVIAATLIPTTVIGTTIIQTFRTFSFERGLNIALSAFTAPLGIIRLKETIRANLWPNVLTTVAELNPGSLGTVVGGAGGKLMMWIALMGLAAALLSKDDMKGEDWLYVIVSGIWYYILLNNVEQITTFIYLVAIPLAVRIVLLLKEKRKFDIKYSVIIMLWLIGTIYAVSKGMRFAMLSIPPIALGFGTAIGIFYNKLADWLKKGFKVPKWLTKPTFVFVCLLLLIPPTLAGAQIASREVPIISDAWWQSLEVIKDNTQEDAIISSWWDFGHWFKYVADRGATFDGAAQDRPQAHWIGKSFLTDKENQAVGILRMLDCSADMGFMRMYNRTHQINTIQETGVDPLPNLGIRQVYNDPYDFLETINLAYSVFELDKEEARQEYLKKYDSKDAEEFLEFTHCQPPEGIYITSGDMIGKSGVWGHFGSWDFERAAMVDFARKGDRPGFTELVSKVHPNMTTVEINNKYDEVRKVWDDGGANTWIAPWPSYAGGASGCRTENAIVQCGNGVTVDLKTMNTTVRTQNQIGLPRSIVYVDGEDVVEKEFDDGASISVVLIPNGNTFSSLLVQYPMGMSMFNRLFYFGGHGLSHFRKLYDAQAITGQRIITWEIEWNGMNESIIIDEWVDSRSKHLTSDIVANATPSNTTVLEEIDLIEVDPKGLPNQSEELNTEDISNNQENESTTDTTSQND